MYVRREKVDEWLDRMDDEYSQETLESIKHSDIITNDKNLSQPPKSNGILPRIMIEDKTTDTAIHCYAVNGNIGALNFASFTNPGGAVNSKDRDVHAAQEEDICLKSNLYNIIGDNYFEKFYHYNKSHKNDGLYENRAIYSPKVIFPVEPYGEDECDILTCAAPNVRYYDMDNLEKKEKYDSVIFDRCKFILDIFSTHKQKTIILGAFGCGVFKNDPCVVAKSFKTLLETFDYGFDTIIFAIPKGNNLNAFRTIFEV